MKLKSYHKTTIFNLYFQNIFLCYLFYLPASYNLVVVVSGALGGLVLTVAVIIISITCRRSRNSGGIDHGFCFGSNVSKGGDSSDIVTVINRKSKNSSSGKMTSNTHPHHHRTGAGSSSTTSTNDSGGEADGSQASNDSSSAELKVEVRTSSSLSQNDCLVDDDDIDDVDGLHQHTHPSNAIGWGTGVKGLHVTSATGTARRGNGVVVAAPVPVHSTTSNLQSNPASNYVHVHPHQQHQHTNNNNTNSKLSSLSVRKKFTSFYSFIIYTFNIINFNSRSKIQLCCRKTTKLNQSVRTKIEI